jgi:hypothetical protein
LVLVAMVPFQIQTALTQFLTHSPQSVVVVVLQQAQYFLAVAVVEEQTKQAQQLVEPQRKQAHQVQLVMVQQVVTAAFQTTAKVLAVVALMVLVVLQDRTKVAMVAQVELILELLMQEVVVALHNLTVVAARAEQVAVVTVQSLMTLRQLQALQTLAAAVVVVLTVQVLMLKTVGQEL